MKGGKSGGDEKGIGGEGACKEGRGGDIGGTDGWEGNLYKDAQKQRRFDYWSEEGGLHCALGGEKE